MIETEGKVYSWGNKGEERRAFNLLADKDSFLVLGKIEKVLDQKTSREKKQDPEYNTYRVYEREIAPREKSAVGRQEKGDWWNVKGRGN